jgi:hypothetical protein
MVLAYHKMCANGVRSHGVRGHDLRDHEVEPMAVRALAVIRFHLSGKKIN